MSPSPDGASPVEELSWDSDFFGIRIARADLLRHELSAVVDEAASRGVDCLYLIAAGEQVREVETAVRRGARIVEFRTTWHLDLRKLATRPLPDVRLAAPDDAPALISLVRSVSAVSRFNADPRFAAERVARMYELQLQRCLRSGTVAVPTTGLTGICAAYVDGRVAYLPLVYTDPSIRHKGLGLRLAARALRATDASRATWATRASNIAALRGSAAIEARMRSFRVVMHLWLDELQE